MPVLDALRAWLDHTIDKIPPSTVLGKAMGYLHNQWEARAQSHPVQRPRKGVR